MKYFYLDESGEFGKKPGSSKHMQIAMLSVPSPKSIRKKVKKYSAKLINDGWPQNVEIKGTNLWGAHHNSSIPNKFGQNRVNLIREVLATILHEGVEVHYIVVNKHALKPNLMNAEYGKAYNYFTGVLLEQSICQSGIVEDIELVVDQRNKETHKNLPFDDYVSTRVLAVDIYPGNISIAHEESHKVEGLQAVDFVTWALFRNFEHRDPQFMDLIAPRVKCSKQWYLGK